MIKAKRLIAVFVTAAVVATSVSHCEGAERPKQSQKMDCFAPSGLAMTKLAPGTRFTGEVKPGARFGKYDILHELAKGGRGKVYLAKDTRSGRLVAIKIISDDFADRRSYIRGFKREGRIQARLRHPSIPEVYKRGSINGRHFISMQYVQGKTLLDIISESGVSFERALEITEKIADVLDYVHKHGIIHLDIKPNNILLDNKGNVYLYDFGLSETLSKGGGFVETDEILGLPGYLSPDAVRRVVDRRSDVYSSGIVLYRMLTGRIPFQEGEIYYHTLYTLPLLPTQFNPHIPEAVEAIVLKAIAKDPNERYQTAGEFADAIRRYLLSDKPPELTVNNEARSALLAPETRFNGSSKLTIRSHIRTAVKSMVRISKIERGEEWTIGAGCIRKGRGQRPPAVVTANHIIEENDNIRHICLEQLGTGLATNGIIYVEPSMGNGFKERDLIVLDAVGYSEIDGRVFQKASAVKLMDPSLLRSGEELFVIGCHLHQGNQVSVFKVNFVATVGGFVFIESPRGRLHGFSGSGIFKIDDGGPKLVGIVSRRSGADEVLCGPSSALISGRRKKQVSKETEREAYSRFKSYYEDDLNKDGGFHIFETKGENIHYEAEGGSVVVCSDLKDTDSINISEFTQPRGICATGFKNGKRHMVFSNLSKFDEGNIKSVLKKIESLNLNSLEMIAFCPNPVRSQLHSPLNYLASNGANIPVVSWNAKKEDVAVSATAKGVCFASIHKGELRPTHTHLWRALAGGLSGEIDRRAALARAA